MVAPAERTEIFATAVTHASPGRVPCTKIVPSARSSTWVERRMEPDRAPRPSIGVFDTDTAAAGAVFKVKRTGVESYIVKLDSLGGGPDFVRRPEPSPVPASEVDWIEFTFFNTVTDTGTPPRRLPISTSAT